MLKLSQEKSLYLENLTTINADKAQVKCFTKLGHVVTMQWKPQFGATCHAVIVEINLYDIGTFKPVFHFVKLLTKDT